MLDVSRNDFLLSSLSFQCSDNVNGRVFPKILDDNAALTTAGCTAACSALNYTIAGIEWSVQCMVRIDRFPHEVTRWLTQF